MRVHIVEVSGKSVSVVVVVMIHSADTQVFFGVYMLTGNVMNPKIVLLILPVPVSLIEKENAHHSIFCFLILFFLPSLFTFFSFSMLTTL